MPSISTNSWNFSGCAFEDDRSKFALGEVHDSEYLAAHFETEVFAPLKLLGGVGEGEAEFAEPVDVGHVGIIAREGQTRL